MTFNSVDYINSVGESLVAEFTAAGMATTPGQIGSARETPVRKRLEQILPRGVAVGSGFVIDSRGSTSQQMDVVLYERDLCPEYSINQDPSTTYYPCEGVLAVGEIKSTISSADLKDIVDKISSTKRLRRWALAEKDALGPEPTVPYRKYGSQMGIQGTKEEEFNQDERPRDAIFGFALAGSVGLTPTTLCNRFIKWAQTVERRLLVDLVVTLDGGILLPLRVEDGKKATELYAMQARHMYYVQRPDYNSFLTLVANLHSVFRTGRTVTVEAYDRYFGIDRTTPGRGIIVPLPGEDG